MPQLAPGAPLKPDKHVSQIADDQGLATVAMGREYTQRIQI